MSGREKIEKDYKESEKTIESEVNKEMAQIKRKASEIKIEAGKIGEALEISVNQKENDGHKKKS